MTNGYAPIEGSSSTRFSSSSRTPSSSLLTLYDIHIEDTSGNKNDSFHKRSSSPLSWKSQFCTNVSGTGCADVIPDINVIDDSEDDDMKIVQELMLVDSLKSIVTKKEIKVESFEKDDNVSDDATLIYGGSDQEDTNNDQIEQDDFQNDYYDIQNDDDCPIINPESEHKEVNHRPSTSHSPNGLSDNFEEREETSKDIEPVMDDGNITNEFTQSSNIFDSVAEEYNGSAPSEETDPASSEPTTSSEDNFEETSSSDTASDFSDSHYNEIPSQWRPKGRGSFRCRKCNKVYSYKPSLNKHVKETHSSSVHGLSDGKKDWQDNDNSSQVLPKGRGSFKCQKCPKVYAYKYSLERHVKERHPVRGRKDGEMHKGIERNGKFGECTQDRNQETTGVITEDSTATKPRAFKCKECSRSYSRKSDLTNHMKRGKHSTRKRILDAPPKRTRDAVTTANVPSEEDQQNGSIEGGLPKRHRPNVIQGNQPSSPAIDSFPENGSLTKHMKNIHPENEEANVTGRSAPSEVSSHCCRFCQVTWLDILHRHEVECEKSPIVRHHQN